VLAEPTSAQGFEWVWRLTFLVFSGVKLWTYRLLAAVVAVPAALLWGVVFAVVSVLYIWVLAPLIRLLEFDFYIIKRVSFLKRVLCLYCENESKFNKRFFLSRTNTTSYKPPFSVSLFIACGCRYMDASAADAVEAAVKANAIFPDHTTQLRPLRRKKRRERGSGRRPADSGGGTTAA